jgi:hypothetical protein
MAKSVRDLLGWTSLCGIIKATTDGIPFVLPEGFRKSVGKTIGDTGRYTETRGTRTVARLNQYGAGSKQTAKKQIAIRDVKLLHSLESIQLDPLVLQALRNYDNYDLQDRGKDEVIRQVDGFKTRFDNLRTATSTLALAKGHIWTDSDGNVLPSSSGAVNDFSYNIPAANVGTIATVTGVPGDMADPATNIPKQFRALKQLAIQTSGYRLGCCLYGRNIPEMITDNTYIKDYAAREPVRREAYLKEGDLTPEYTIEGIKFYPGYEAFFEDKNGVNQKIVDDNALIFFPDPNPDWWDILEGTYEVPTTMNPFADGIAAREALKQVYGKFSYAMYGYDPVGINMYSGDTFFPCIKVPAAVFQLTSS